MSAGNPGVASAFFVQHGIVTGKHRVMAILYKGDKQRGRAWRSVFSECLPDVEFRIWPAVGDAGDVRYVATWEPIDELETRFPNLEVIFSTGAGVDQFDLAGISQQVHLVRLIDPTIVESMREYVALAVLALHRRLPEYLEAQAGRRWQPLPAPIARDVSVGIMGLGVLGQAVLEVLEPLGFSLCAWSRSPHERAGVRCFAGTPELYAFAAHCNILVCLLPLTDATRGILDRRLFDAMPRGGSLVNVGRGGHLREEDLLAALEDGQLSGAVLDVTKDEPLPENHPFWAHERIILTPHIASTTGYESAASVLVDNIRRHRRGDAMTGLVDRESGY